ncbi:MAG: T9SS type A sorting domain-containing protein, partial [Bacteroidota bacterium]
LFASNPNYDALAGFPFESLGVLALTIMFLMAATSHDFWNANLGPGLCFSNFDCFQDVHLGVIPDFDFYSVVSVDQLEQSSFNWFVNDGQVRINQVSTGETARFYALDGRLISEFKIENPSKVDIPGLLNGMFVLQIGDKRKLLLNR